MRTGWRRTNAVPPWPDCPASGNVIPTIGPIRSHGSRRSCRRGAETAAGLTADPVPVTGSPGLLTQLTTREYFLCCRVWSSMLVCSHMMIHTGTARRNVQPSWKVPGEALFPGRLPQRPYPNAVEKRHPGQVEHQGGKDLAGILASASVTVLAILAAGVWTPFPAAWKPRRPAVYPGGSWGFLLFAPADRRWRRRGESESASGSGGVRAVAAARAARRAALTCTRV